MNDLNSVVFEGIVEGGSTIDRLNNDETVCFFSVKSAYTRMVRGKFTERVTTARVETRGRLAEHCFKVLAPGRGVRIAGRLSQDEEPTGRGTLYIEAEHVEFKRVWKDSPETISL